MMPAIVVLLSILCVALAIRTHFLTKKSRRLYKQVEVLALQNQVYHYMVTAINDPDVSVEKFTKEIETKMAFLEIAKREK